MRELLLAYLFGQLDADQRERVERALANEPRWQDELRQLRACLGVDVPGEGEAVEPPPDLVERTCRRVVSYSRPASMAGKHEDVGPSPGAEQAVGAATGCRWGFEGQRQYSRGDLAVALGLTLVAAMLLFPAMHDSRVLARRTACQNNMRSIFLGLSLFANGNGGLIPHVPAEGKESFAGIYSVILGERQLIDRQELPQLLVCPGTIRVGDWERDALLFRLRIPTRDQLLASREELLRAWQRRLGGDYAYRLGYVDEETTRYRPWRMDHSSRSAILSDAPSLHMESFRSANHGGHGQNVAFADGHVRFVCEGPELACGDELFKNSAGYRAAAYGSFDSVLMRSEEGPGLGLIDSLFEWGSLPR